MKHIREIMSEILQAKHSQLSSVRKDCTVVNEDVPTTKGVTHEIGRVVLCLFGIIVF